MAGEAFLGANALINSKSADDLAFDSIASGFWEAIVGIGMSCPKFCRSPWQGESLWVVPRM